MAYVYKHVRLDTQEIFYIGIGSDNKGKYERAYEKSGRNIHWHNIAVKAGYEIKIIIDNLTWQEACDKEIELIKFYGRKDLKEGCLVNMTDGGEGANGAIPWNKGKQMNDESKIKMSQNNCRKGNPGYKHTQESKDKMSKSKIGKPSPTKGKPGTNLGKKFSEETKQKMSKSSIGNTYALGSKRTEESKEKIRLGKQGDKSPWFGKDPWNKGITHQVICPHCNKTGDRVVMSRWHFDKCKYFCA